MVIDAVSTGPASRCPGSTTYTWNHVCNGDLLLVGTQVGANPTESAVVTGITAGGVAMTFIRADVNNTPSPRAHTELWYLIAPPAGTIAIVVTITSTNGLTIGDGFGISFIGADQAEPIDAHNGATGTGTAVSTTVTTVTDNTYVVDVFYGAGGFGITVGADQTALDNVVAVACGGGGYQGTAGSREFKASAGAAAMTWTLSGSESWAQSAVAIKPAPVAITRPVFPMPVFN